METKYSANEQELPQVNEETLVATASHLHSFEAPFTNNICIPCSFTDEEWKEEILLSEESGVADEEETSSFYKRWGFAL